MNAPRTEWACGSPMPGLALGVRHEEGNIVASTPNLATLQLLFRERELVVVLIDEHLRDLRRNDRELVEDPPIVDDDDLGVLHVVCGRSPSRALEDLPQVLVGDFLFRVEGDAGGLPLRNELADRDRAAPINTIHCGSLWTRMASSRLRL
jgi:hypothetical protein